MSDFRGGVSSAALAIGAMTPAERATGRYMRSPDGHGAAALAGGEGGDGDAAAAAAAAAGGADPGDKGGAGGEIPPQVPAWAAGFSADPAGEGELSNQVYVAKKGFKTADDLVAAYRAAEKAIHEGGRIKVPGEGAKADEIAAFHKAIGVPEKPEGYEIKLPAPGDGEDALELDTAFLTPMAAIAHQHGVPKAAFEALGQAFIEQQLAAENAEINHQTELAENQKKEWGAAANAQLANYRSALGELGLGPADIAAIQKGYGSDKTLALFAKLGGMMGESPLIGGERKQFGMSPVEAQAKIDEVTKNPEKARDFTKRLLAKDPATVAAWDLWNEIIAADRTRKQNAGD